MKKLTLILSAIALLPSLAWVNLASNKELVDLECYQEKGRFYYRGIWNKGKGGQALKRYESPEAFEADAEVMSGQGYALRDIALKEQDDAVEVVAVYDKNGETSTLVRINSWDEFESDWQGKQKEGLQIQDFDFYTLFGEEVYYGIYRKMDKKSEYFATASWTEMSEEIESRGKKKYCLMDVDRAMVDGSWHYVAFFNETEKELEYKAFKVTGNDAVERQAGSNAKKGVILVESDGFIQGNAIAHLTVYVKQPQPNALFAAEEWEEFEKKFMEFN